MTDRQGPHPLSPDGPQPHPAPGPWYGSQPPQPPRQPVPAPNAQAPPGPFLPQQPPYPQQPAYPQQPYFPPPAGYRPRRRRRLAIWLGAGGAIAVAAVAAVAAAVTFSGHRTGDAPSALDAPACPAPAQSASGPGPWKVTAPRTLCGLPIDSRALQADQADLGATESDLGINGITYTSGASEGYETPNGADAKSYRFVTYLGFNGRFNPARAMSVLESGDDETFHSVPAGPHGGLMACAEQYPNVAECVWATATTLCDINIEDTSLELVGTHADANAIRIRSAVEVLV